jgi:hypothetical protein
MSNELAMLNTALPDYLRTAQIDDTTKALMGGGSGASSRRISIKGGVWRLMINGKEVATNEDRHMNVVIVAASPKVSRTFYAQQYQEGGEISAPDCWSADGEVPDVKASSPQSKRCIDCPQNVQGSGQGNSRACRYSQRLAVVLANDVGGDVFQLTLPATSIFGEGAAGKWPLQAYAKMLGSKGIPITAVVTEMRFDTGSATPKINFKPVSFLDAGQHQLAINQGSTEAAKRAITMTVAEADNVKPKAIAAPKPAAPVEVVAEPVEAVAEPVKRSSKKNEEAAEKPDLSKILAEWDD